MTGSDDLLIAVPMAARTRSETESVVGLFSRIPCTIRIRVDQNGDAFSDLGAIRPRGDRTERWHAGEGTAVRQGGGTDQGPKARPCAATHWSR